MSERRPLSAQEGPLEAHDSRVATGRALAQAARTKRTMSRLLRGIGKRLLPRTKLLVWTAAEVTQDVRAPEGYRLLRIKSDAPAVDRDLVEDAMRLADEPPGLVETRLAHGDECFAWLAGNQAVCFCWATYRDRFAGPVQLEPGAGRVFLLNGYTLGTSRGRGLYTALLLAIRSALGREGLAELVADINSNNAASLRSFEKAGFRMVAEVSYATMVTQVPIFVHHRMLDSTTPSLFRQETGA